jgi:hypothetical protein
MSFMGASGELVWGARYVRKAVSTDMATVVYLLLY